MLSISFNYYKQKENWESFLVGSKEVKKSNNESVKIAHKSIEKFISSSVLNFESNRKVRKALKEAGYSNYEVNEFFKNSKKETITKLKEKALPFFSSWSCACDSWWGWFC